MNNEKQQLMQESLKIAKTIQSQIHKTVLMSSAARNYKVIPNGLMFNISNTSKYKYATVKIVLNGLDYYDITIFNVRKKIVDTKKDIYCDQLNVILDDLLEKKDWLKTCPDSQYYIKKESV